MDGGLLLMGGIPYPHAANLQVAAASMAIATDDIVSAMLVAVLAAWIQCSTGQDTLTADM